jgi:hypothetical protein
MKATAKALLGLALSATCLLSAPGAMAQAYPSKPIRMIVPFPAGGTTDIVARIVAQRMSESMGQPVTVDNRGGAGGAIGADVVAKAAPDGYTIMMHNLTFPLSSVAQTLSKRSPFNPETDFAGVAIAVYVPFVLDRASRRPGQGPARTGQPAARQSRTCNTTTAPPARDPRCTCWARPSSATPRCRWSTCPSRAPRRSSRSC